MDIYTNITRFYANGKNPGLLFNSVMTPYLTQSDADFRQRTGPMPWVSLGLVSGA